MNATPTTMITERAARRAGMSLARNCRASRDVSTQPVTRIRNPTSLNALSIELS